MTEERINELEGLGFKRWQKNGMDRLYINASLGLVLNHYKTGNVSGAWFKGETISNSKGLKMSCAKTFIDVRTGLVYSQNEKLAAEAASISGCEIAE